MKNLKLVLLLSLSLSHILLSQGFMRDERGPFPEGKIAELEKIKLIEVLDLDEETMLKFFSRRNIHFTKMKAITLEKDSLITDLNFRIKNESKTDYNIYIRKILSLDEDITLERKGFIESLKDILSSYQLAKLIVFEKRFRNEIRKELLKQGKRMRGRIQEFE